MSERHRAGRAAMRRDLWPDEDAEPDLAQPAWLAIADDGAAIGFAEANLRRDYVNGCDGSPVAFPEGLYVAPDHRRRGVARALVEAVAAWASAQEIGEFASDVLLDNHGSHALHAALGFVETERVVYFRRVLR